jgi:hypothetical protein
MIFEETPRIDFEVKDLDGKVVYRDSIAYATISELRNDSTVERQAKFQQRYDAYLIARTTPTEPPEILEEE